MAEERKALDPVENFDAIISDVWDVVLRVQMTHGLVCNTDKPRVDRPSGHDIVEKLHEHCDARGTYSYHCAMTSHDVKEFAWGVTINQKLALLHDMIDELRATMSNFCGASTPAIAKTHGKACATTTWGRRFEVLVSKLPNKIQIPVRSPCCGIIGDKSTMLEVFDSDTIADIEAAVSNRFGVTLSDKEFQTQHRSADWVWCSNVGQIISVLESLCWFVRLAYRDGIASTTRSDTHVASSAMPHKDNPVEAEKIQGRLSSAKMFLLGVLSAPAPLEEGDVSDSHIRRTSITGLFESIFEACSLTKSMLEATTFVEGRSSRSDIELATKIKNGANRFDQHAHMRNTNDGVPHTRMFRSKRHVDVLRPKISDVDIEDIAFGLSVMPRFNGQTKEPYSVATHCVLAYKIACNLGLGAKTRLAALLHDAHEAYIGDQIRPIKKRDHFFESLEHVWQHVISAAFDVRFCEDVSKCDRLALYAESHALRDEKIDEYTQNIDIDQNLWYGNNAMQLFLETFAEAKAAVELEIKNV